MDPVGGHRARGVEALAGEEDGVGQEASQLTQVLRAAFAQVAEGFGGHARGHCGQRHQLGVRGGLAAQGDQRPVAAASAAVSAATPCGQAFRPPRSLSTTRSARAASPVTSSAAVLAGLAVR